LTPYLDTGIIEEPSVKVDRDYIQGQTFAITKWDLWWKTISQCPN